MNEDYIASLAMQEIADDDYVVLDRLEQGFVTYEKLETFSGIIIERRRMRASDAEDQKRKEDRAESHETDRQGSAPAS